MERHTKQINYASDGKPALATTLSTLCTLRQTRAIQNFSAQLRIDDNEISQLLFRSRYEELSFSGAEDVIAALEKLSARQIAA